MNRLFKSWVAAILRPEAHRRGLRLREQGPRRYVAHRKDIDKPVFQMKPDISFIYEKKQVTLIADAKWKMLDSMDQKLGVAQSDLYQIQSYANRYNVKDLLLVYPAQGNLNPAYEYSLMGQHEAFLNILTIDITKKPQSCMAEVGLENSFLPLESLAGAISKIWI